MKTDETKLDEQSLEFLKIIYFLLNMGAHVTRKKMKMRLPIFIKDLMK